MIPLIAASEKGTGQTESPPEKEAEMWWSNMAKSQSQSSLERDVLEGDNPVDKCDMLCSDRVGPLRSGV